MSRLAQLGVFCMVLGAVVLFLGLFPGAVNADVTPGIGLVQIIGILTGLVLLVLGAYVVTRALPRTCRRRISRSRTCLRRRTRRRFAMIEPSRAAFQL